MTGLAYTKTYFLPPPVSSLEPPMFKRIKIRSYETGLYFRDGEFKGLLGEGRHWLFDLFGKVRVDVANKGPKTQIWTRISRKNNKERKNR